MALDDDYMIALQLQRDFDREDSERRHDKHSANNDLPSLSPIFNTGNKLTKTDKVTSDKLPVSRGQEDKPLSVIDPRWEVIDPAPDARAMFMEFNDKYFWGKLRGVEVRWSPRMTLCAGVCCYEGRGGLCSIRLSEPLLKLRPRKDLVETLLHEMIHALLFVTNNNRDRDGHGPEFCKHMNRINEASGSHITIYHDFHDEVKHYQQHWWRCDGPCVKRPPYYGYVKRAMNRAPSPRDFWWPDHQHSCGGTYHKVKEPERYGQKKSQKKDGKKDKPADKSGSKLQDIRNVFKNKTNEPKPGGTNFGGARPKTPTIKSTENTTSGMTEGNSSGIVSVFSGSGKSIGESQSISSGEVIRRKIPGIGVIESRMTAGDGESKRERREDQDEQMDKVNAVEEYKEDLSVFESEFDTEMICDDDVKVPEIPPRTKRKFVDLSPDSDDEAEILTVRKPPKRQYPSVADMNGFEPVGTIVKVSGFKSVCNKNSGNKKKIHKDSVREPLAGKEDEHHVEYNRKNEVFDLVSSSSDSEEEQPLSSALKNMSVQSETPTAASASNGDVSRVVIGAENPSMVSCPVCMVDVAANDINAHLDRCLS